MKSQLFYVLLLFSTVTLAQNKESKLPPTPVSFHPITMDITTCISDEQRQAVLQDIKANRQIILDNNPDAFQQRTTTHPLFTLPLRPKDGFEDYGYYSLFNQVDHDPVANGNLLDYNCGERTYDWVSGNHGGTDYVVWPYPWKKMDDDVMEVIAAAPGVIIQKEDGNFDRNCTNNGNPNWNGIILEHADGSQTWYWHFKSGAITNKNVGDSVAQGEYLGGAGSSGSSDIPHLHFEVFDANGDRIDPYAGPCNSMNTETWWAEQPDYFIPEILTLSTHNSDNFDTDCGITENTYEELNFLPNETIRFRIFYRDLQTDARTHITVTKPDDSILYDYNFDSTWPDYTAAWAEWNFPVESSWMDGVYTITAEFGGNTYETIFGVNTNLGLEDLQQAEIKLYPNPTNNRISLDAPFQIDAVQIYDLMGRKVIDVTPLAEKSEMDLSHLTLGIYMAVISFEGKQLVKKIVKE
ncbi:peptidoglycan DD-metalloendopeptidase family protein [Aequorivita marina]|uniref:peptidoglycan DD-metalloendopeptidase family protein n=1 Tax=Aequorivita marina TaxID=3073654 RepID=UPI002876CC3A|nr:peptidoglycan DD-metalloendopeptidase family protein [Aequorivita sp. S2608]MDS1298614.1 peptidoglycan DD-metalloendopeptidase family protein [Aequorivita sp. S2608]